MEHDKTRASNFLREGTAGGIEAFVPEQSLKLNYDSLCCWISGTKWKFYSYKYL